MKGAVGAVEPLVLLACVLRGGLCAQKPRLLWHPGSSLCSWALLSFQGNIEQQTKTKLTQLLT